MPGSGPARPPALRRGAALAACPGPRATLVYRTLADGRAGHAGSAAGRTRCWPPPGRSRRDGSAGRDVVREGAWQAIGHAGLELAERLARAARAAEPGAEADRLLAEILAYRGRGGEAVAGAARGTAAGPGRPRGVGDHPGRDDVLGRRGTRPAPRRSRLRGWPPGRGGVPRVAAVLRRAVRRGGPGGPPGAGAAERRTQGGHLGGRRRAAPPTGSSAGRRGIADDPPAGRGRRRGPPEQVPWGAFEVDVGACLAHLAGGHPAAAQAIADAGYRARSPAVAPMMVSGWALYAGLAALARGHLEDAGRLLAEASAGFETNDTFRLGRCCLAARAAVAALTVRPAAPGAHGPGRRPRPPVQPGAGPWIELWRAWTAYAGARPAGRRAAAGSAADLARASRHAARRGVGPLRAGPPGRPTDLARLERSIDTIWPGCCRRPRGPWPADGARALEVAAAGLQCAASTCTPPRPTPPPPTATSDTTGTPRPIWPGQRARARRRSPPAPAPRCCTRPRLTSRSRPREREVLLLAADHTSAQIAARLDLACPP